MNRNEPSNNFSRVPKAEISRSTFDRSASVKTTFNVGQLIPFYVDEVLPGDTFSVDTSKVVRLQTPTVPFMDNLYLDTYYFFVPNRLVWDHWKEFMGENTESAWIPKTQYQIPQIAQLNAFQFGTVADYMGLPVKTDYTNAPLSVNALPFRAYALICNEWFRDENLQEPLLIPTGDATGNPYYSSSPVPGQVWTPKTEQDYIQGPATGTTVYVAGKFHDYFTSALPSPQKGEDVTIPLVGALLPVVTTNDDLVFPSSGYSRLVLKPLDGSPVSSEYYSLGADKFLDQDVATLVGTASTSSPPGTVSLVPTNLGVDVTNATMSSINALRLAFQTQKYFEKLARGGSRYIESIKVNFGVTNPDYRLQRPEYLGGNRLPFNVQQVTQTSSGSSSGSDASTPLGFNGAQSLTTDVHSDFTKSFTEHGYIIGVCVARYHHSYQQNLARMWSRKDTLDFYFPVFANIGEQPILKQEIYYSGGDGAAAWNDSVFGYQEAWAEYRYRPSIVTSEMRSAHPITLDYWHFADKYADDSRPALSSSWIMEDPVNVNRALRVSSLVANQIFCDFYIKCKATRPMPLYSVPGLIDHH